MWRTSLGHSSTTLPHHFPRRHYPKVWGEVLRILYGPEISDAQVVPRDLQYMKHQLNITMYGKCLTCFGCH